MAPASRFCLPLVVASAVSDATPYFTEGYSEDEMDGFEVASAPSPEAAADAAENDRALYPELYDEAPGEATRYPAALIANLRAKVAELEQDLAVERAIHRASVSTAFVVALQSEAREPDGKVPLTKLPGLPVFTDDGTMYFDPMDVDAWIAAHRQ
jgi:hypothetical protein